MSRYRVLIPMAGLTAGDLLARPVVPGGPCVRVTNFPMTPALWDALVAAGVLIPEPGESLSSASAAPAADGSTPPPDRPGLRLV